MYVVITLPENSDTPVTMPRKWKKKQTMLSPTAAFTERLASSNWEDVGALAYDANILASCKWDIAMASTAARGAQRAIQLHGHRRFKTAGQCGEAAA